MFEYDESDLCSGCGGTGEMGAYCSRDMCSRCNGSGLDPGGSESEERGDDAEEAKKVVDAYALKALKEG